MSSSLSESDAVTAVRLWREILGGRAVAAASTEQLTVQLPLGTDSSDKAPTELLVCSLLRVLVSYKWHVMATAIPESLPSGAVVESLATLPGRSPTERYVVACSSEAALAQLGTEQEREQFSIERVPGAQLVARMQMLARSERLDIAGLSLDPSPNNFAILAEPRLLGMLQFVAAARICELALCRAEQLILQAAREGAPPGLQKELAQSLHRGLTQPTYWVLVMLNSEQKPVTVGTTSSAGGNFSFVFTSPDLALRHYVDAKQGNAAVPNMVVNAVPQAWLKQQSETGLPKKDEYGYWFNAPGRMGGAAELQGVKMNPTMLRHAFNLVDTVEAAVAAAHHDH